LFSVTYSMIVPPVVLFLFSEWLFGVHSPLIVKLYIVFQKMYNRNNES
jgi:hypothetical protein